MHCLLRPPGDESLLGIDCSTSAVPGICRSLVGYAPRPRRRSAPKTKDNRTPGRLGMAAPFPRSCGESRGGDVVIMAVPRMAGTGTYRPTTSDGLRGRSCPKAVSPPNHLVPLSVPIGIRPIVALRVLLTPQQAPLLDAFLTTLNLNWYFPGNKLENNALPPPVRSAD